MWLQLSHHIQKYWMNNNILEGFHWAFELSSLSPKKTSLFSLWIEDYEHTKKDNSNFSISKVFIVSLTSPLPYLSL